jgi:hypothetical protein
VTVKVEREDPTDPASNVWLTAFSADGRAELGAYIPANARRDDPSLSVFWCGDTSRSSFRKAVERTEHFFLDKGGYVLSTLLGYGPSKTVVGPITRIQSSDPSLGECLTDTNPLGRFSAYRAEFYGAGEQVILWANVVEADTGELEENGDNIGICTSPTLFDGLARTLIVDTIEETRGGSRPATRALGREIVSGLLTEIAEKVHQTVDPPVST